ncbi:hypothetical protein [Spiroplasma turonicum]|uniref:Uncharacterized protein n=1 Tax=Spiroplasma turonicum TaxID=216946 RepID=A0A0K1P539_9MOLU|nr:hypothetical protein [Spiroplasma turonicum]AKU79398.1 hypothetical protein STURON_00152 [Spiroplasma turonicum]ALX70419.1 hypothetical protein STURO_v1c01500 [Spiroplasma turonicum]
MFKLLKLSTWMFLGMMLAPKRGVEIRKDFVEYLKKYRPQIKKFIAALEDTWEKSQSEENDEVIANIEMKLSNIRNASDELDNAKTKEIAYKALQKLGKASLQVGKDFAKSKNAQLIAKDLASIAVDVIDQADVAYSKVKDVSISMSDDVLELEDSKKVKKEIKEK